MIGTATAKGLRSIIGLVSSILIARQLGVADKGDYSYFLLILSMISGYAAFGIHNGMLYHLKRSSYDNGEIVNTTITFQILQSLAISVIIVVLYATDLFKIGNVGICLIFCVYILGAFIRDTLNSIHIGDENVVRTNFCYLMAHIIRLGCLFVCYCFHLLNVTIILAFELLDVVACCVMLSRTAKVRFSFAWNGALIREELIYSAKVALSAFIAYCVYQSDQFLVKNILGSERNGIYSTAAQLCDMIRIIPASIAANIMGSVFNKQAHSDDAKSTISYGVNTALYATFIVVLFAYACMPLIPLIYGKAYAEVVPILMILAVGVSLTALGSVTAVYFQSTGEIGIIIAAAAATWLTDIALCLVLLPVLNIYGAAIASVVSYIVYSIIYLTLVVKRENISLSSMISPRVFVFNIKEILADRNRKA